MDHEGGVREEGDTMLEEGGRTWWLFGPLATPGSGIVWPSCLSIDKVAAPQPLRLSGKTIMARLYLHN